MKGEIQTLQLLVVSENRQVPIKGGNGLHLKMLLIGL